MTTWADPFNAAAFRLMGLFNALPSQQPSDIGNKSDRELLVLLHERVSNLQVTIRVLITGVLGTAAALILFSLISIINLIGLVLIVVLR